MRKVAGKNDLPVDVERRVNMCSYEKHKTNKKPIEVRGFDSMLFFFYPFRFPEW